MQPDLKQVWSADTYAKGAGFVPAYGEDVLAWLKPVPGERILDLGCGDGTLTAKLVEAGATVVGVDASPDFVVSARDKGIDAHEGRGEALQFDAQFDAVFSNAAIHWMPEPEAVIAGVKRALVPGGRFVGEFGGHGNVAAIVTAMRALAPQFGVDPALAAPWFFPSPERYRAMLEAAGFTVDAIALIPRPTPLPGAMREWLQIFRTPFFEAAGKRSRELLDEVEALLAQSLRDEEGRWTADYVRLRFVAHA